MTLDPLIERAFAASAKASTESQTLKSRALRTLFGLCAYCAGAGSSGFVVGHITCLALPFVSIFTPQLGAMIGAESPYDPKATLATASLCSLVLLGGWYAWRGRGSSAAHQVVIGVAVLSGLTLNLWVALPHQYDMNQAYLRLTQGNPELAQDYARIARANGQSFDDYLKTCIPSDISASRWERIKLIFSPRLG
jgi:hypothetical protein